MVFPPKNKRYTEMAHNLGLGKCWTRAFTVSKDLSFFLRASTGTYRTDRNITRLLQYYSLPTMWMSEWPPFLWPPRLELFPCSVWPHFPEGNKCPQCTQLVVAFPLPVLLWRDLYQIAWVTFLSGPLRPRTESFLPKVCRHKWFPANPAFHGHARPSFSPLCPLQHSSGCRVQYMCDHKSYCKFPYLVQNEGSSGEGEKRTTGYALCFFFPGATTTGWGWKKNAVECVNDMWDQTPLLTPSVLPILPTEEYTPTSDLVASLYWHTVRWCKLLELVILMKCISSAD
jgi:hypothetical protein